MKNSIFQKKKCGKHDNHIVIMGCHAWKHGHHALIMAWVWYNQNVFHDHDRSCQVHGMAALFSKPGKNASSSICCTHYRNFWNICPQRVAITHPTQQRTNSLKAALEFVRSWALMNFFTDLIGSKSSCFIKFFGFYVF